MGTQENLNDTFKFVQGFLCMCVTPVGLDEDAIPIATKATILSSFFLFNGQHGIALEKSLRQSLGVGLL